MARFGSREEIANGFDALYKLYLKLSVGEPALDRTEWLRRMLSTYTEDQLQELIVMHT